MICGDGGSKAININQSFVMKNSYREKGCSAYVLVEGSSWNEAQKNAVKIGGNLTTPNNKDENNFLVEEYKELLKIKDPNWINQMRSGAWIGLSGDKNGELVWSNGDTLEESFKSPFGSAQNFIPDEYLNNGTNGGYLLLMIDPSGHAQNNGGLDSWWREPVNAKEYYKLNETDFWGYNWGIAEIPICS